MSISFTRRKLLGSAVALAYSSSALCDVEARGRQKPAMPTRARQKTSMLSIALLDTHWTKLEPLAADFEETLGIALDATPLGFAELYSQISLALTQRATTFDVVLLTDAWIPQFASFLKSLDRASVLSGAISDTVLELGRYPERAPVCAIPWLGETQFFARRSEWFEYSDAVVPETWDRVVEMAATIAARLDPQDDLAAFGMRTRTEHELVDSFLPILRGFGKTLIDPETNIPQLDTPSALAAMEVFLALMAFSPIEGKAVGDPTNAELFEQGRIGMMSNFWASDLLNARSIDEVSASGTISTGLQPAQPGIERQALMGVWLAGIPVGSLQVDSARSFVDWLISLELQQRLPGVGLPPVRNDILDNPVLGAVYPELTTIGEMLQRATPRGRSPFYPQLEHLLAMELSKAVTGETKGGEALKTANLALRQFLVREGVLDG